VSEVTYPWRHGPVVNSMIGRRIEHYSHHTGAGWFRVIGTLIELDGEPGMDPTRCELMEFVSEPPVETDGVQVWRDMGAPDAD